MQGAFTWYPCKVLSYDPATELYEIQWLRSEMCSSDPAATASPVTGSAPLQPGLKHVRRLNLLLQGESRSAFRARLLAARQRREDAATLARFEHYVRQQPFHNQAMDPQAFCAKVAPLGLQRLCEAQPALLARVLGEVAAEYEAAVKRGIVLQAARSLDARATLLASGVRPPQREALVPACGRLDLSELELGCDIETLADGAGGCCATCSTREVGTVAEQRASLTQRHSFAKPHLLRMAQQIASSCKIADLTLVDTSLAKLRRPMPVRLCQT